MLFGKHANICIRIVQRGPEQSKKTTTKPKTTAWVSPCCPKLWIWNTHIHLFALFPLVAVLWWRFNCDQYVVGWVINGFAQKTKNPWLYYIYTHTHAHIASIPLIISILQAFNIILYVHTPHWPLSPTLTINKNSMENKNQPLPSNSFSIDPNVHKHKNENVIAWFFVCVQKKEKLSRDKTYGDTVKWWKWQFTRRHSRAHNHRPKWHGMQHSRAELFELNQQSLQLNCAYTPKERCFVDTHLAHPAISSTWKRFLYTLFAIRFRTAKSVSSYPLPLAVH